MTSAPAPPGDSGAAPDRLVLEGVPKIGYHVHLCPFPGSLYSVMQYLGDPVDYDYLMGVTGAAFRRFWNRDDGGNVDLSYLAPEPSDRAAEALGYEFRPVGTGDKARIARAVRQNIAKGRPLLAFGIIGPPECGIITGYDQGGKVLYGYSYFQDPALPGYYEKSNWFETATWAGEVALLRIGDRKPIPPKRNILISSLKWAVDLERTAKRPTHPDHITGLAAYEGWASGLEVDGDYPTGNPKVLGTRTMVHGDQCVMLEERHNAARYLRLMVGAITPGDLPRKALDELETAAALYDEVADLGSKVWLSEWGFDMSPEVGKALADADTRREIAKHVRQAGGTEAKAVEHLEAALRLLKSKRA
jgi:hypothetical protein